MDPRFQSDAPIESQLGTGSRRWRLLFVSLAILFSLAFCFLTKPAVARAAWAGFTHIIQLRSQDNGKAGPQGISDANLALLRPQQQAEFLLEAAVNHSDPAASQIMKRADSWRGRLTPTSQLLGLLNTALNSDDMQVRAAALESELAVGNLAKNRETPGELIDRIQRQPAARPWALWMLGALGNRGVEPDRTFATLIKYAHDPDEKTRYWAVEGLSLFGNDQSIQVLLEILHSDPSGEVRERAACALAQAGMLTKQQRRTAVPTLIDYASDSSLDAGTHTLVYRALQDITGADVAHNSAAWRDYWAASSSR